MKQHCTYKSLGLVLIHLLISQFVYAQNYQITGLIINGDTKQPIDSAVVYIFGKGYLEFTHLETDSTGRFQFDNLKAGRYNFHIIRDNFKTERKMIEISDSSVYFELQMFHVDSSGMNRVDDIAYEDNYHGGFAVNFYNPTTSAYKTSFNIEYIYSYKKKVTTFDQFGLDLIPIKLAWHNFNKDKLIANDEFQKERYFGYYISAFAYNRLFINKQRKTGYPGFFVDLGIGYEFPIYFKYFTEDDSGNKSSIGNIHKRNEFVGLVRIGFDIVSIKATYTLNDTLKDNYPQPPQFRIGIELNFPKRYI